MNIRYGIPALVLGLVALGSAGTAYAFTPGFGLPEKVLASFSSDEQDAIREADDIRRKADEEANAVLEAAGISEDEVRDAMGAYRKQKQQEMEAAVANSDYAAFSAIIADSPMEGNLSEAAFQKLVEAYKLDQSGDHDGAMAIRKELRDDGVMPMGPGGPGGPGGHRGPPGDE